MIEITKSFVITEKEVQNKTGIPGYFKILG
jgi:hypothetical protein